MHNSPWFGNINNPQNNTWNFSVKNSWWNSGGERSVLTLWLSAEGSCGNRKTRKTRLLKIKTLKTNIKQKDEWKVRRKRLVYQKVTCGLSSRAGEFLCGILCLVTKLWTEFLSTVLKSWRNKLACYHVPEKYELFVKIGGQEFPSIICNIENRHEN